MSTRFLLVLFPLAAAGMLVVTAAPSTYAQNSASEAQYRARVSQYRQALASSDRAVTESARARLASLSEVRRTGETTVTLPRDTFASSVRRDDATARAALLDNLLTPPLPAPERPDPKAAAQAILANPEYAEAQTTPKDDSWLEQILRKMSEAIRNFLRWLFGSGPKAPQGDVSGIGTFLALLLRFLLFAAIAVGVIWGGLYLSRWVSFRRTKVARGNMASGLDLEEAITDPLATAKELAARGEMRQALRLAYIASLRRLAGSGLLVLQESRTNWEYQSALRARSQDAYNTLLPATRLFDLVWYGRREATPEEFTRVLAVHDALPEAQVADVAVSSGASGISMKPGPSGSTGAPAKKGNDNGW